MSTHLQYTDWGMIDYKAAWDRQVQLFDRLLEQKADTQNGGTPPQYFVVCEHPHVYTLGRNGKAGNLLVSDAFLKSIGATYYHIERGGDITYHGPGQVVGYPILDLEALHLSMREYIHCIEEAIVRTLADYGIGAGRMNGATGVWLDVDGRNPRKICAIGVRIRRYVTMHGFALNVNTDLAYFSHINPCGFTDRGVTSMQQELGRPVLASEVARRIYAHFIALAFRE
jgi:lipoyl(octanoyl) transferase